MRNAGRIRNGFTLIELLVVLIIIGILIALLAPAVMAAIVRARETAVDAEILSIGQTLTSFKARARFVCGFRGWKFRARTTRCPMVQ